MIPINYHFSVDGTLIYNAASNNTKLSTSKHASLYSLSTFNCFKFNLTVPTTYMYDTLVPFIRISYGNYVSVHQGSLSLRLTGRWL